MHGFGSRQVYVQILIYNRRDKETLVHPFVGGKHLELTGLFFPVKDAKGVEMSGGRILSCFLKKVLFLDRVY